ncbi:helix-turn-helix domain-containing protein [Streptomyces showdoensis]|uniref:helix-turn-helix domain-containing protein n=1 Tax=Streptomyces showdoensis TaxID=68268 RepID=UPI000F50DB69|nr:helix-turn-helix transcriptional regulator [Streptomyces showdoensis]
MSEQQRGKRAIEIGPTGKTVSENLARMRQVRGLSTRQLSGILERAGRPISASGITRMEKGDRVVSADELVALAAVLKVNPSALLLPLKDAPEETVELSGAGAVSAADAWAWVDGERPLVLDESRSSTDLLDFDLYSRPPRRRRDSNYLMLRGERSREELAQARQKYELLASVGGASLDRLRQLDPEAFEGD